MKIPERIYKDVDFWLQFNKKFTSGYNGYNVKV